MSHPLVAVCIAVALVVASAPARSADCGATRAGYRVLDMPSGRKVAVWYPTDAGEEPTAYARATTRFKGSVARDAAPAACTRLPLVLFSHGLGGCALQSVFITEELARHGYVVAAPDHQDAATCGIDGEPLRLGNLHTEQSLLDPAHWSDRSEAGRLHDLRDAIARVQADPLLARIVDAKRIGAIGHSLGGYAVLGLAGGWPAWRTPEVKAVVALSPYVTPFLAHGTLPRLAAPVMYQGAQFDWGITPAMEGAKGAYALSPAPKYYVKLAGGTHLEWTNVACTGQASVAACLQANANAGLITRYALEFFGWYLKGEPSPVLAGEGRGLEAYRFQVR